MKFSGHYSSVDVEDYDIDHVINETNELVKKAIEQADTDDRISNKNRIIASAISTLSDMIE